MRLQLLLKRRALLLVQPAAEPDGLLREDAGGIRGDRRIFSSHFDSDEIRVSNLLHRERVFEKRERRKVVWGLRQTRLTNGFGGEAGVFYQAMKRRHRGRRVARVRPRRWRRHQKSRNAFVQCGANKGYGQ